jgi:hypothetical protein
LLLLLLCLLPMRTMLQHSFLCCNSHVLTPHKLLLLLQQQLQHQLLLLQKQRCLWRCLCRSRISLAHQLVLLLLRQG